MFYADSIAETRALFFSSWEKYMQKKSLTALEAQLVEVMKEHPEYHHIFENTIQLQPYYHELGETNPFLHMGLHLAIREQVATDRPFGIKDTFDRLLKRYANPLEIEHKMMDHLVECLWLSQKNNAPPDESAYLASLAAL
jgi:hypothetical protein